MGETSEQIADRIRQLLVQLRKEFPVLAVYLFGSRVSGESREFSDIDVGIVVPDNLDGQDRFTIFSRAKDFDVDFDILVIPERDFISEDPLVVHEMKTKGIRVA